MLGKASSTGGPLIILDKPIVAVIQLATQPKGVVHQVILSPEKVKGPLIRLGEFPGDEANGWVYLELIEIVATLGDAILEGEKWKCVPRPEKTTLSVVG